MPHPTVSPTQSPTTSPIPVPAPTLEPTLEPKEVFTTTSAGEKYEMIEDKDISVKLQRLSSISDDYFNGGIRTEFYATIQVKLDSTGKLSLFQQQEATNGNETVNITIKWKVYKESPKLTDVTSVLATNGSILKYNEFELTIDTKTLNKSTYDIDSYFIMYQTQSVSQYSSLVCESRDDNIFEFGSKYVFVVDIEFEWNSQTASNTTNVTLIANTPPTQGNCIVKKQLFL